MRKAGENPFDQIRQDNKYKARCVAGTGAIHLAKAPNPIPNLRLFNDRAEACPFREWKQSPARIVKHL
ncbi:hypothetical protein DDZ15_03945 [Rhodohalobacter mucosus]|uniref:Uncharacterized protein n=1 Tax=Rhodohalobacter mucosus TaxID=2079485 RepID=A0A316TW59_9BACT|nr:hypothetical protein DDZ15_03945 [Rhodohalobacter mucosus]